MKRKPRWTLEMLTASLAVLCGLLLLVLLVQRPTAWPLLAVLVVLGGTGHRGNLVPLQAAPLGGALDKRHHL